ncbi:MAG TPA: prolyl oligopeptidase family serine peptidase [Gemmatimonadales bacterium]|nr:prolyl oligopeptidase family serine peptidase [Gemmatimonadales bacterium]
MIEPRDNIRRLALGAVLAFMCSGIFACGGDGEDVSGPEPPSEPPVDEGITPAAGCTDGVLEHGALYQICFPADWNGDIVLYAHGHVGADEQLALPDQQFNGKSLAATINDLRYAYATTSYRRNGLVGPEGVDDLVELEATVRKLYRPDPVRTVLVGVSEGGMIVGLAVERHPDVFDGALSACGPVGSMQGQLDYFDDFRVVFDYLFPGIIPGTAIEVPAEVAAHWEDRYAPAVALALVTKPSAARELVRVTGLPVERDDIVAIAVSAIAVLSYNVTGTADAQQRLGGQPFDNTTRVYSGSDIDAALNVGVARFTADPAALAEVRNFETTGSLQVPVATLHTTGDPVVPFGQEALYREKVDRAGFGTRLTQDTVDRYGHCTFEAAELLGTFSTLVARIAPPLALRR